MVEHRPWNDVIAYAILTLGVFIVAFPVYIALIASTHDAATVVGGSMPLTVLDRKVNQWIVRTNAAR